MPTRKALLSGLLVVGLGLMAVVSPAGLPPEECCTPAECMQLTESECVMQGGVPCGPGTRCFDFILDLRTEGSADFVGAGVAPLPCQCVPAESGSIRGRKWHDLNGDGVWDIDEPTLEGWRFFLEGEGVEPRDAVTDEIGAYLFAGLSPGAYIVTEEPREGWVPTSPAQGSVAVPVEPGEDVIAVDFGNATVAGGALLVEKRVEWNGLDPDPDRQFEICVTGPSLPQADCRVLPSQGGELLWTNLELGQYVVTEPDPGSEWIVSIIGSPAEVAGEEPAVVSVSNTIDLAVPTPTATPPVAVTPTPTATTSPVSTPTLPLGTATATPSSTATGSAGLVVNTTGDLNDGSCDVTHCSLREAIGAANLHAGPDTITFAIPPTDTRCDAQGVCTIRPAAQLVELTGDGTTIDGFTQNGARVNTTALGQPIDSVLKIVLDGSSISGCCPAGLMIRSSNHLVRGLVVQNFYRGIELTDAADSRVEGCFLGTDVTGRTAMGNECGGVVVSTFQGGTGSTRNVIGGAAAAARNLISGNGCGGVGIGPDGRNRIFGNYIGTDATGTAALPNLGDGVRIFNVSTDNEIGGTVDGQGNLIAFNTDAGVEIDGGTDAVRNAVITNRIWSNAGSGVRVLRGGNGGLAAPVIMTASSTQVVGTSCASCLVQVFSDAAGQGRTYEGEVSANAAGSWSFAPGGALTGPNVTATATDANGNTSEFSAPISLSEPTRTATATPTSKTMTVTRTPSAVATETVSPGVTVTRTAGPVKCIGDCNGDGSVTVDEIVVGINIALGLLSLEACPSFDIDGNGRVTIDELLRAVDAGLLACA